MTVKAQESKVVLFVERMGARDEQIGVGYGREDIYTLEVSECGGFFLVHNTIEESVSLAVSTDGVVRAQLFTASA